MLDSAYLEILKKRFIHFASFLSDEWEEYGKHADVISFKKKEILTSFGEVENYVYFILKGAVRLYFKPDNREICLDFGFEQEVVSAYVSFLTREPSQVAIQTLLPGVALRIRYEHIQHLHDSSKNHERFGRLMAEHLYITKLKREMILLSLTAEEKYQRLMHEHPNLIQHLPVKDIASYLGIHPESLSRIRRNLNRK